MERFINVTKMVTIALLVVGMVVYGLILLLFALGLPRAAELVESWPPQALKVPMAGISAFGIVSFLERPNPKGELEFKAFSLEFTGPAVPATIWVVVFLSIMIPFSL